MPDNDKIQIVIDLLDKVDDEFLIQLLENKINKNIYEYKKRVSVTDREKRQAKYGLALSLAQYELEQNKERTLRIQAIINNRDCNKCELAIKRKSLYTDNGLIYGYPDDNNDACESCAHRCIVLERLIDRYKLRYKYERLLDQGDYDEIIELKAIINKVNKKLYKLKTQLK